MVLHKKPTAKEIQEQLDKNLAELDTPTPPEPEKKEELKEEKPEETTPASEAVPAEEETPSPAPTPAPAENEPEDNTDYKKKYVESSRESQILHSRNKKFAEAIESANSVPEPTEPELLAKFPDWDVMSDTEKMLAKDNLKNKKAFEILGTIAKETKDQEAWNGKVDTFIEDPKTLIAYPELDGHADEFKVFASKPTRRGVDLSDITSAFLFERSKTMKKNKGSMFETGVRGPKTPPTPKSDKISVDEASLLRRTDYKKYKKYLLAGKIDQSDLQ